MTSARTSAACATFAATRRASAPADSSSASVSRRALSVRSIVRPIVAAARALRDTSAASAAQKIGCLLTLATLAALPIDSACKPSPSQPELPLLAPPRAALRRMPDERLARLAARGSEAAFAAIFERHHQALHRYCHSIVGNGHDASDALQSTMLKAYRALSGETREITLQPVAVPDRPQRVDLAAARAALGLRPRRGRARRRPRDGGTDRVARPAARARRRPHRADRAGARGAADARARRPGVRGDRRGARASAQRRPSRASTRAAACCRPCRRVATWTVTLVRRTLLRRRPADAARQAPARPSALVRRLPRLRARAARAARAPRRARAAAAAGGRRRDARAACSAAAAPAAGSARAAD